MVTPLRPHLCASWDKVFTACVFCLQDSSIARDLGTVRRGFFVSVAFFRPRAFLRSAL